MKNLRRVHPTPLFGGVLIREETGFGLMTGWRLQIKTLQQERRVPPLYLVPSACTELDLI